MLKSPYRVIVIPQITAEPSEDQMTWMNRQLRMLAASALNMGLEGDCIQVWVYPMARNMKELPHWAATWRRPQHSVINLLGQVHAWCTNGTPADFMAKHVMAECVSFTPDEVWCLNAVGHGQLSNCPPLRVWRHAQERHKIAAMFKLVPSWVNSDAPEKPVKEKKDAKGNVPRSFAPARKAGKGTARGGSGAKRGRDVAQTDKPIPWFDSGP